MTPSQQVVEVLGYIRKSSFQKKKMSEQIGYNWKTKQESYMGQKLAYPSRCYRARDSLDPTYNNAYPPARWISILFFLFMIHTMQ